MGLDIVFRKAEITDAAAISTLLMSLSRTHIAADFPVEGRQTLLDSMLPERIVKYIESGFKYFMAESENALVGVVAIKDKHHLYHLFVAEPVHRQGLGRRLWEVAKSSSANSTSHNEFTVNSSPNAQGFYEKLGFEKASDAITKSGITFIPMVFKNK